MRKTVLITGASGGLGLEFARIYAREGFDLVVVARSEGKLYKLKSELETQYDCHVWVLAQDLSQPDAAYEVFNYTLEKNITIDALVNNAGFGDFGNFWEVDAQRQTDLLQVNIMTLVQLTRYFLPGMVERRHGSVLNLSSVAAFSAGPRMCLYYASTILAPQMSPIHFDILEPVFRKHGYNLVVLDNDNRSAVNMGLKYVNNDACYPSITVVGQFMDAVLSGKYDTDRLAIVMTQTGGCCRASNYVSFIRRALDKAGYSHIPVISLNANGMEKNEGFSLSAGLVTDAAKTIVYGDLFMRCLYRVRPYEVIPGSADALHKKWQDICIDSLINSKTQYTYKEVCRGIVNAFDSFPIDETIRKPRVGIVGEILVKYMPLANNHLVELLEREGAEVVVPDLLDFFNYCVFGSQYKAEYLGTKKSSVIVSKAAIRLIAALRKPATDALNESKRFEAPLSVYRIAEMTKPFLSLGNQYGEGWFLAGEMIELITHGTPNVVCIQPFACLPNHVVGKGVIKALKKAYPQSNIAAVDYDPGASEVNQLNRIKLMLSTAKKNIGLDG